jgi:hypothetical protein
MATLVLSVHGRHARISVSLARCGRDLAIGGLAV